MLDDAPPGATYMADKPEKPEVVRRRPPTYDQHARELYNLRPEWEAYCWEAKGEKDTGFIVLKGGVYLKKVQRGKNKGRTDHRNPEPGTEATLSLSNAAHETWLRHWEVETGHCAKCFGTGLAWAGWHHIKGAAYRPCTTCGATGRATSTTDPEAPGK
jgi:hypothetical protein